ncbi:hypothetical protein DFH06DRAFT_1300299 [Mycena polygramma]|nr:hypothetical protein DFH06DRAFT_1300299 [Mycena polygramma]
MSKLQKEGVFFTFGLVNLSQAEKVEKGARKKRFPVLLSLKFEDQEKLRRVKTRLHSGVGCRHVFAHICFESYRRSAFYSNLKVYDSISWVLPASGCIAQTQLFELLEDATSTLPFVARIHRPLQDFGCVASRILCTRLGPSLALKGVERRRSHCRGGFSARTFPLRENILLSPHRTSRPSASVVSHQAAGPGATRPANSGVYGRDPLAICVQSASGNRHIANRLNEPLDRTAFLFKTLNLHPGFSDKPLPVSR